MFWILLCRGFYTQMCGLWERLQHDMVSEIAYPPCSPRNLRVSILFYYCHLTRISMPVDRMKKRKLCTCQKLKTLIFFNFFFSAWREISFLLKIIKNSTNISKIRFMTLDTLVNFYQKNQAEFQNIKHFKLYNYLNWCFSDFRILSVLKCIWILIFNLFLRVKIFNFLDPLFFFNFTHQQLFTSFSCLLQSVLFYFLVFCRVAYIWKSTTPLWYLSLVFQVNFLMRRHLKLFTCFVCQMYKTIIIHHVNQL